METIKCEGLTRADTWDMWMRQRPTSTSSICLNVSRNNAHEGFFLVCITGVCVKCISGILSLSEKIIHFVDVSSAWA